MVMELRHKNTEESREFRRMTPIFTLILLFAIHLIICCLNQEKFETEINLFAYQEIFQEGVIIVVGNSEHALEMEGAKIVAETLEDVPKIENDSEVITGDIKRNNLILLGNARTNDILREIIYTIEDPLICEEHQTHDEGVLELIRNPWNPELFVLIIAGDDPQRIRDICKYLSCGCISQENDITWIVIDFSTDFISISGLPVVIGNEPFSQVAIDTGNEIIGVIGTFSQALRNLQYVQIEAEGFLQGRTSPSFRTEKSICIINYESNDKEVIIRERIGKELCLL